jgi:LAS superfamily LD-carboxypeptidase LdcB
MASSKPGVLGKKLTLFGHAPGALGWSDAGTPGVLGRRDWAAPDFTAVRTPLRLGLPEAMRKLSLGSFKLRLGSPRSRKAHVHVGLPDSKLSPCATAAETEFKHRVYLAACARASMRRSFSAGVPATNLETVEGDIQMKRDAATAAKKLFAELRATLKRQQAAGDAGATKVKRITLTSGYRDPEYDFGLWDSYYEGYFQETVAIRKAAAGGELGSEAADLLARYIGKYKAAPGFSNHTRGIAMDITTIEGKTQYRAKKKDNAAWENTWLRQWMLANAGRFGFRKLATEAWHWDYEP